MPPSFASIDWVALKTAALNLDFFSGATVVGCASIGHEWKHEIAMPTISDSANAFNLLAANMFLLYPRSTFEVNNHGMLLIAQAIVF